MQSPIDNSEVETRKYIEGWESKDSEIIRDGLILQAANPDLRDFEIVVSEAFVPPDGYNPILNTVRGQVIDR